MFTLTVSLLPNMKQTINYDFTVEPICSAVAEVLEMAQVKPLSITFRETEFDNVTVEFNTTDDAIRFTEVYLDSEDPGDIMEYVVGDALDHLEELRPV